MQKLITIFLICVCLGLASCVSSGRRAARIPTFESLDANADNRISGDELETALAGRRVTPAKVLDRMDTDKDGFISRVEYDSFTGR